MLRLITKDNKQLKLTSGDISFVRRNHLLSVDNIPKDFSFPFVVPVHGNERVFKYLHNIASQEREVVQQAYLEVNGSSQFSGLLRLERADKDYYRATLESDLDTQIDINKKLPELFQDDTIAYSDENDGTPMVMNDFSWPVAKYCWPSWQNDDEYFTTNYLYARANPYHAGSSLLSSGSGTIGLNAALYLPEALERIAAKLGYTAEGTYFTNQELCKLFVWNNNIVRWNAGVITLQVGRMLPDITIFEFFRNIRAIGITTEVDTVNRRLRFDLMNTIADQRAKCTIDNVLDRTFEIEFQGYNGLTQDIVFDDDHGSSISGDADAVVPDKTVNWSHEMYPEGLAPPQVRLINGFNMYFYAGDVVYCTGDNSYYVWDENDGQYLFKYNASKYATGEGDLSLPDISTVTMFENIIEQLLPRVNHPVSDLNQYNSFGFKVLFNRGIIKNTQGYNYAFATPDNYKMNTVPNAYLEKYGLYSLLPNREDSVTRKIVAPYYELITRAKQLSGILHGDWVTKHRFTYDQHLRMRGTNFIWKQLQFSLTEAGFGPTHVEMLKIT